MQAERREGHTQRPPIGAAEAARAATPGGETMRTTRESRHKKRKRGQRGRAPRADVGPMQSRTLARGSGDDWRRRKAVTEIQVVLRLIVLLLLRALRLRACSLHVYLSVLSARETFVSAKQFFCEEPLQEQQQMSGWSVSSVPRVPMRHTCVLVRLWGGASIKYFQGPLSDYPFLPRPFLSFTLPFLFFFPAISM